MEIIKTKPLVLELDCKWDSNSFKSRMLDALGKLEKKYQYEAVSADYWEVKDALKNPRKRVLRKSEEDGLVWSDDFDPEQYDDNDIRISAEIPASVVQSCYDHITRIFAIYDAFVDENRNTRKKLEQAFQGLNYDEEFCTKDREKKIISKIIDKHQKNEAFLLKQLDLINEDFVRYYLRAMHGRLITRYYPQEDEHSFWPGHDSIRFEDM